MHGTLIFSCSGIPSLLSFHKIVWIFKSLFYSYAVMKIIKAKSGETVNVFFYTLIHTYVLWLWKWCLCSLYYFLILYLLFCNIILFHFMHLWWEWLKKCFHWFFVSMFIWCQLNTNYLLRTLKSPFSLSKLTVTSEELITVSSELCSVWCLMY